MNHPEQTRLHAAERLAALLNTALIDHTYPLTPAQTLPTIDAITNHAHDLCDQKLNLPNKRQPGAP